MARTKAGMPQPATGDSAPPEKVRRGRAPAPPSLPIAATLADEIDKAAAGAGVDPAVVKAVIAPAAEAAVSGQVAAIYLRQLGARMGVENP